MCVIAVVRRNVKFAKEYVEAMWVSNPHGGGFAYYDYNKGVWIYEKGFMQYEKMLKRLRELDLVDTTDHPPFVVHFRITSVGETNEKLTHPFEITLNDGYALLFHNGTLDVTVKRSQIDSLYKHYSYYSYHSGMVVEEDESDTSTLAKNLSELKLNRTQLKLLLKEGGVLDPLRSSSRFAICYPGEDEPQIVGSWDEHGDLLTSNSGWKAYLYKEHTKPNYKSSSSYYYDRKFYSDYCETGLVPEIYDDETEKDSKKKKKMKKEEDEKKWWLW